MKKVNIHEAKTHLSRLIEAAAKGESFVIAKAGRPLVEVRAVRAEQTAARRIGFLKARMPEPSLDVAEVGSEEIAEMFGVGAEKPSTRSR